MGQGGTQVAALRQGEAGEVGVGVGVFGHVDEEAIYLPLKLRGPGPTKERGSGECLPGGKAYPLGIDEPGDRLNWRFARCLR